MKSATVQADFFICGAVYVTETYSLCSLYYQLRHKTIKRLIEISINGRKETMKKRNMMDKIQI